MSVVESPQPVHAIRVFDERPSRNDDLRVVQDEPQEGVGVEQHPECYLIDSLGLEVAMIPGPELR